MNKQQLAAKIWESANQMRSKIEANEYKDYILGFIFYKYLSDQLVQFVTKEGMTPEDIDLSQGMIDLDELNFTSNAKAAKKAIDSTSDADLLMKKYPGMSKELAEQIANDPNPERKAQVLAMVEQTMELDKLGKSGDEIIDIFKKETIINNHIVSDIFLILFVTS